MTEEENTNTANAEQERLRRRGFFRQILTDDRDIYSCGRLISLLAMIGALTVLLGQAFGYVKCDRDYNTPITFLAGGALGAKAAQKAWEK